MALCLRTHMVTSFCFCLLSLILVAIFFPFSPTSSEPPQQFYHPPFLSFNVLFSYGIYSLCAFVFYLLLFSPYVFLFRSVSPHLSPSLTRLSASIPSSLLPPIFKANTASPCLQSKTLLCPLCTVLESHCRPATQYAQWPRGLTMAHFNLNFPRNEWECTPVHAAGLLIGLS